MNCYRFEEILSDYLENNLTLQVRSEAEHHLLDCSSCRIKVLDMKELMQSLNNMEFVKSTEAFVSRLEERIIQLPARKNSRIFFDLYSKYAKGASIAAALFLILTGFYISYNAYFPNLSPSMIPRAELEPRTFEPAPQPNANQKPLMVNQSNRGDTTRNIRPDFRDKIKLVNEKK